MRILLIGCLFFNSSAVNKMSDTLYAMKDWHKEYRVLSSIDVFHGCFLRNILISVYADNRYELSNISEDTDETEHAYMPISVEQKTIPTDLREKMDTFLNNYIVNKKIGLSDEQITSLHTQICAEKGLIWCQESQVTLSSLIDWFMLSYDPNDVILKTNLFFSILKNIIIHTKESDDLRARLAIDALFSQTIRLFDNYLDTFPQFALTESK